MYKILAPMMPHRTTITPRFHASSGLMPCLLELRTLIHKPSRTPVETSTPEVGAGVRPCTEKASRPTRPCGRPRMNPSVDVGNPPRSFRHLRMTEHCTPDQCRDKPPFIRCWFKNRLPPSPTLQADFQFGC